MSGKSRSFIVAGIVIYTLLLVALIGDRNALFVRKVNKASLRVVEIDSRGRLTLDSKRVNLDQIERELVKVAAVDPRLVVKVRADKNVDATDFYGVFEILQRNGISLGLETEAKRNSEAK